jgi:hypothetical protein
MRKIEKILYDILFINLLPRDINFPVHRNTFINYFQRYARSVLELHTLFTSPRSGLRRIRDCN